MLTSRYVAATSHFFVGVPLRNKEALTVANAINIHVFAHHGFGDLQADRGGEFKNQFLDAIVAVTGQHKYHTTAFKPSTNGKVERFHRTFNSMLAKVVAETQTDWSEHLPYLVFSYNACAHLSTGLSPFFLMTGQNPRWNIDLVLDNPSVQPEYDNLSQYARDLVDRLEHAYHIVRDNLQVAADRNSRWYNKSVRERLFDEGDKVRIFVPRHVQGRTPKLESFYKDEGTVVKRLNDATYVINCP